MSDKVIRLPVAKRPNDRAIERRPWGPDRTCDHHGATYFYDESEAEVTCGGCGAKLNPVWVLAQLSAMEGRWIEGRRAYLQLKAEHEKRRRCKCQHCGQMTRIRGM